MGGGLYMFALASQADLDRAVALLKEHNAVPCDEPPPGVAYPRGEDVYVCGFIKVAGVIHLLAANGGGHESEGWLRRRWGNRGFSGRPKGTVLYVWVGCTAVTDAETYPADGNFPPLPTYSELVDVTPFKKTREGRGVAWPAFLSADVIARRAAGTLTERERSRMSAFDGELCDQFGRPVSGLVRAE